MNNPSTCGQSSPARCLIKGFLFWIPVYTVVSCFLAYLIIFTVTDEAVSFAEILIISALFSPSFALVEILLHRVFRRDSLSSTYDESDSGDCSSEPSASDEQAGNYREAA